MLISVLFDSTVNSTCVVRPCSGCGSPQSFKGHSSSSERHDSCKEQYCSYADMALSYLQNLWCKWKMWFDDHRNTIFCYLQCRIWKTCYFWIICFIWSHSQQATVFLSGVIYFPCFVTKFYFIFTLMDVYIYIFFFYYFCEGKNDFIIHTNWFFEPKSLTNKFRRKQKQKENHTFLETS